MDNRRSPWLIVTLVAVSLAATSLVSQEKGGGDETGPYDLVPNWPHEPVRRRLPRRLDGRHLRREPGQGLHLPARLPARLENDTFGTPQGLAPTRNAADYDLSARIPSFIRAGITSSTSSTATAR